MTPRTAAKAKARAEANRSISPHKSSKVRKSSRKIVSTYHVSKRCASPDDDGTETETENKISQPMSKSRPAIKVFRPAPFHLFPKGGLKDIHRGFRFTETVRTYRFPASEAYKYPKRAEEAKWNHTKDFTSTETTLYIEDSSGNFKAFIERTERTRVWSHPAFSMDEQWRLESYVFEDSSAAKIFRALPTEIHQSIASFLPDDRAINVYSSLCKTTQASITSSVWRERFIRTFDKPEGFLTPYQLEKKHKFRSQIINGLTFFDSGSLYVKNLLDDGREYHRQRQIWCLEVLRDLILESNAHLIVDSQGKQVVISKNMDLIQDFVSEWASGYSYTDILQSVLHADTNRPFTAVTVRNTGSFTMVVQVSLMALSLHPDRCTQAILRFDESQREMFAAPTRTKLFVGKYKELVNLRFLVHAMNYFRFHLKAMHGEGLLSHAYRELAAGEYPRTWLGKLKSGVHEIGKQWKSTSTFMRPTELKKLRKSAIGAFMDEVDDCEHFQDVAFTFDEHKFGSQSWPIPWERILESNPFAAMPKNGESSTAVVKQFYGMTGGNETSHIFGRIHAVPAQHEITGFQRVTMMRFYQDAYGHYDPSAMWGYEGVVLPGNQIIVGRWYAAQEGIISSDTDSGPCLFWNVDELEEPEVDCDEALHFFNNIQNDDIMGGARANI